MKIHEVITEDLSRRGFLRGLGAAAVTGTTGSAKAGQYKSMDELQQNPEEIERIWKPRMAELETRCHNILKSFIDASSQSDPRWVKVIQNVKVNVTLGDTKFNQSNPARMRQVSRSQNGKFIEVFSKTIQLEVTVFWDAPNDTLAFVLGHECGHAIMEHNANPNSKKGREAEIEADMIGAILAKKIGYNRSSFFEFLFHVKADRLKNGSPKDPHPEPADRVKLLKTGLDFELANNSIKYIDSLTQKFQQGLAEEQIEEDSFDETLSDIKNYRVNNHPEIFQ